MQEQTTDTPLPAADAAAPAEDAGTANSTAASMGAEPSPGAAPAWPPAAPPESPQPQAAAVAELSPQQCAAALAERFPALFALQQPLPLKLRIQADIQARAPGVFTRKSLSICLHRYTTGTPYLKALAQQPHRHDLDGQPAGDVAAEHREAATAELARRRALLQARRAAERGGPTGAGRPAGPKPGRPSPSSPREGGVPTNIPTDALVEAPSVAPARREPRQAGAEAPPRQAAGPRPERRPRPGGHPGPRGDGPRRGAGDAARAGPPAQARPPRPAAPRSDGGARKAQPQTSPPAHDAESQQRRERAQLLRAFEASPLSPANFAALKGLSPAQLEQQLQQARREAATLHR
jgi:ProP effector